MKGAQLTSSGVVWGFPFSPPWISSLLHCRIFVAAVQDSGLDQNPRLFLFFRCSAGFVVCCTAGFRFPAVQDFCRCSAGFGSGSPKPPFTGPLTGVLSCSSFFPAAQHFFPAVQHLRFPAVQRLCFPAVQHFGRLLGALVPTPSAILGPLDGAFEKHPPVLVSWPWLLLVGDFCLVSKRSVSEWLHGRGGGENEGVKT